MKILLFIFLALPFPDGKRSQFFGSVIPYQIIISEILADPSPPVLLPEAEYIELFNRSDKAVDISGWRIVFGDNTKVLGNKVMQPGTFLIVCDAAQEKELAQYGPTLPVSSMPAIVNSGQSLTLKNSSGHVMHTVTFSQAWFESPYKKEGGYSLEMVDVDNPCGMKGNWKECTGYLGGTPGAENSVKAPNRDMQPPELLRAVPVSATSVRLLFSESMDSASLSNPFLYSVNRNVLHPASTRFDCPDYASVMLHFTEPFRQEQVYRLMVLDSLMDCVGNRIGQHTWVDLALPQPADSFDVVINEVLFDASSQRGEFIELYNRSVKTVDLSDFSLSLADPFSGKTLRMITLKEHPFLLFPEEYVAIASNLEGLPDESRDRWLRHSVEVPALFTLNDDEGTLMLHNKHMQCIDRFTYSVKMHAGLLTGTEGISLERIIPGAHSEDPGNWHSAAASQGFSTPGYANSQLLSAEASHDREIHVTPDIFSPDNDGLDDFITIGFRLLQPGYLATIAVFDVRGQRVRTLSSNLSVGTECLVIWDGRDDTGMVPAIGIYLLYIELFHPQGNSKTFRKALVLSRKLQ